MPDQGKKSPGTAAPKPSRVASISDGWRDRLIGGSEDPKPGIANALTALQHAPEWTGVLAFDAFSGDTMAMKQPPWQPNPRLRAPYVWRDEDDIATAAWMQHQGIWIGREISGQAVQCVAREQWFHPVRDYLNSLKWDSEERIEHFVPYYLGAGVTDYNRCVGAKWLIAAVARIFMPGCQSDSALILEGDQGILKSSALRVLGGEWSTDDMPQLGTKDAIVQLRGSWIIDLSELSALKGVEPGKLKAFLSRRRDRYRPHYQKHVVDVPRECVFAGTVNLETYLGDETGNRRFWPVACGNIDIEGLKRDRDQLWAEAVVRFRAGATWWLDDKQLVAQATREARERYVGDPWDEKISGFLAGRDDVSVPEVLGLCLGKKKEDWTQQDQNRVARSLRALGWKRFRQRNGDGLEWRYRVPGSQSE